MNRELVIKTLNNKGLNQSEAIVLMKEYLIDMSMINKSAKKMIDDPDVFIAKLFHTQNGFNKILNESLEYLTQKYNVIYIKHNNNILKIY